MQLTIAQSMSHAAQRLAGASDSPRLDAELLLADTLGLPRSQLVTRAERTLSEPEAQRFFDRIARRATGEPVAYLLGEREFYSLRFAVDARVLVPRPETELLVERALQCRPAAEPIQVLDLGTGSGAIAITLASERPSWRVTAIDVDTAALALAAQNAAALGIAHILWHAGHWYAPLARRRFDLIVSNPPYIAADDPALAQLHAEPRRALTPGPSGLEALREIIVAAPDHLLAQGRLLVEHGHEQGHAVAAMMRERGFDDVQTHADLAGLPRVTEGIFSTSTREHS